MGWQAIMDHVGALHLLTYGMANLISITVCLKQNRPCLMGWQALINHHDDDSILVLTYGMANLSIASMLFHIYGLDLWDIKP